MIVHVQFQLLVKITDDFLLIDLGNLYKLTMIVVCPMRGCYVFQTTLKFDPILDRRIFWITMV